MASDTTAPSPPPEESADRDAVDVAMELAAAQGWAGLTLADIAQAAGLPLSDMLRRYPTKLALLDEFQRRMDQQMLPGPDEDAAGDSPRDRLFAVIMRRFDALAPHRQALVAIWRDTRRDPLALCAGLKGLERSLMWMLEAAGLDSGGLAGIARRKGLGLIYLDVLKTWRDDDSADMAKTMAALDKRLKRAEAFASRWQGRRAAA